MKKGSTYVLGGFLVFLGLVVLAICIFGLPVIWKGGSEEYPMASRSLFLIMMGLYATAVPFFIALWQALKLLRNVDQNIAFSDSSIRAIEISKHCWIVIAILYIGGVPLLFPIAQADDAPGLVLIGAAIAFITVAVAAFAAVLEKLLRNGMELKSENDLTV